MRTEIKKKIFESLNYFTNEGIKILQSDKYTIEDFGKLLTESWTVKKSLANMISNPNIDSIFEEALDNGATGGKLLGAGAGGFLMFLVARHKQKKLTTILGLSKLKAHTKKMRRSNTSMDRLTAVLAG